MSTPTKVPKRLSILDDEDDMAAALERRLTHKGYELVRVVPQTPNLEDIVTQITAVSDAALCDHHLRGGHHVHFSGAEVVATLTKHCFPAVLFTGMLPQERYAIQRNMALIPAFITRDEGMGADRVLDALTQSVNEISNGHRSGRRRGRRTPVTIVGARTTAGEHLIEVEISGWAASTPLEISADLLASSLHQNVATLVGKTFLATVNISEKDPNLVFFEDFDAEALITDTYEGIGGHGDA